MPIAVLRVPADHPRGGGDSRGAGDREPGRPEDGREGQHEDDSDEGVHGEPRGSTDQHHGRNSTPGMK